MRKRGDIQTGQLRCPACDRNVKQVIYQGKMSKSGHLWACVRCSELPPTEGDEFHG